MMKNNPTAFEKFVLDTFENEKENLNSSSELFDLGEQTIEQVIENYLANECRVYDKINYLFKYQVDDEYQPYVSNFLLEYIDLSNPYDNEIIDKTYYKYSDEIMQIVDDYFKAYNDENEMYDEFSNSIMDLELTSREREILIDIAFQIKAYDLFYDLTDLGIDEFI